MFTELHRKFSLAISGSQKARYYFQVWEAVGTPFVNFLPGVIAALCLDKSLGLSSKFSSLEDGQRWLKVEQLWERNLYSSFWIWWDCRFFKFDTLIKKWENFGPCPERPTIRGGMWGGRKKFKIDLSCSWAKDPLIIIFYQLLSRVPKSEFAPLSADVPLDSYVTESIFIRPILLTLTYNHMKNLWIFPLLLLSFILSSLPPSFSHLSLPNLLFSSMCLVPLCLVAALACYITLWHPMLY